MADKSDHTTLPDYDLATTERVESELLLMNETSTLINHLEKELAHARSIYSKNLTCYTSALERFRSSNKRSIERCKDYFEDNFRLKQLKERLQKTATDYNEDCKQVEACAKVMEAREQAAAKYPCDVKILELLNLSLIEWNKANLTRCKSRECHEAYLEEYKKLEMKCKAFEAKNKSSVRQAKPFYTCLEDFRVDLLISKDRVESCEARVLACKKLYSSALSNLERISDSLHKRRKSDKISVSSNSDLCSPRGERTRGVGSDSISSASTTSHDSLFSSEIRNLDPPAGAEYTTQVNEICSQRNSELLREINSELKDASLELKTLRESVERMEEKHVLRTEDLQFSAGEEDSTSSGSVLAAHDSAISSSLPRTISSNLSDNFSHFSIDPSPRKSSC